MTFQNVLVIQGSDDGLPSSDLRAGFLIISLSGLSTSQLFLLFLRLPYFDLALDYEVKLFTDLSILEYFVSGLERLAGHAREDAPVLSHREVEILEVLYLLEVVRAKQVYAPFLSVRRRQF